MQGNVRSIVREYDVMHNKLSIYIILEVYIMQNNTLAISRECNIMHSVLERGVRELALCIKY